MHVLVLLEVVVVKVVEVEPVATLDDLAAFLECPSYYNLQLSKYNGNYQKIVRSKAFGFGLIEKAGKNEENSQRRKYSQNTGSPERQEKARKRAKKADNYRALCIIELYSMSIMQFHAQHVRPNPRFSN